MWSQTENRGKPNKIIANQSRKVDKSNANLPDSRALARTRFETRVYLISSHNVIQDGLLVSSEFLQHLVTTAVVVHFRSGRTLAIIVRLAAPPCARDHEMGSHIRPGLIMSHHGMQ